MISCPYIIIVFIRKTVDRFDGFYKKSPAPKAYSKRKKPLPVQKRRKRPEIKGSHGSTGHFRQSSESLFCVMRLSSSTLFAEQLTPRRFADREIIRWCGNNKKDHIYIIPVYQLRKISFNKSYPAGISSPTPTISPTHAPVSDTRPYPMRIGNGSAKLFSVWSKYRIFVSVNE